MIPDNHPGIVFVPPLRVVLQRAEQEKGAPLVEAEVIQLCNKAMCMTVPFSAGVEMVHELGYVDVVPEDCWKDWQRHRRQINGEPEPGLWTWLRGLFK